MRSRWSYSSTNCDDLLIIVNYADGHHGHHDHHEHHYIHDHHDHPPSLCLGNACLAKALTKPTP